jgi:hypothetical protein
MNVGRNSRKSLRWLRRKPLEWIARYGPAEVVGTVCAWAGSWIVYRLTRSEVAAAYGAAMGENCGFYGVMILREHRRDRAANRTLVQTMSRLLLEFGPAELLDSFLIRPAAMGIATHALGRGVGVIVGKLIADVTFYLPVIVSYELGQRRAGSRK